MSDQKLDLQPRPIATPNARDIIDQPRELARVEQPSDLVLLLEAVKGGIPPDALVTLVGLCNGNADRRAKAEFFTAKAKFHGECPPPPRLHRSQFDRVTREGTKVPRMYADLQDIATTMNPHLAANGFSYRWDTAVEGPLIAKTCHLSHVGGHTESATARYPFASSAGCSEAQKYGSAGTYAARDSLISVAGMTSCDEDDDGEGAGNGETITVDQQNTLNDLIIQVADELKVPDKAASRARLLAYWNVEKLADMKASQYDRAIKDVESKRKAKP